MRIRGQASTRRVWLNQNEIKPTQSQAWCNHSPDGFEWGYGGSGPAQLALALCLKLFKVRRRKVTAVTWFPFDYQRFKCDIVAKLPQGQDFEIELDEVDTRERYKREHP